MSAQCLQPVISLLKTAHLHQGGVYSSGLAAACQLLRRIPLVANFNSSCSSDSVNSANINSAATVDAAAEASQQEGVNISGTQIASSSSSSSSGGGSSSATLPAGVFQATCKVAGKRWTFETGRLAKLAHGSCVVTVGGTSVLSTAVVDPTPQLEADGVPLQVEYRERLAAAGRLPSRPDRRERSGSDREVLAGRLIDRSLRPLLAAGHLYDTQVWCQVLSADGSVAPEVVAVNAASAALLLARHIPFTHPIGAVRAAQRHSQWVMINPSASDTTAALDLTYAGSPSKATAIEATAKPVSNQQFIKTLRWAAAATAPLIRAQLALAAAVQAGSSSSSNTPGSTTAATAQLRLQHHTPVLPFIWPSQRLQQAVQQLMEQPLQQLFSQQPQQQQHGFTASDKESRAAALAKLQHQLLQDLQRMGMIADDQTTLPAASAAGLEQRAAALRAFDMLQSSVMRRQLLQGGCRVDGRAPDELRPVSCEVGPLARCVHGSGLFSRGDTQSLATATVGHSRDVGQVESLFSQSSQRHSSSLTLHYSFPPFSVGELGKSGPPNRRELGHGNLARAALVGLMPSEDEFPFDVRLTADTLSSSGSSSMAAVCAGSLALRAAGVPMQQGLAAGISVGLVTAKPPQLQGPDGAAELAGVDSSVRESESLSEGMAANSDSGGGSSSAASYSRHAPEKDRVYQHEAAEVKVQAAPDDRSSSSDEGSSSSSSSSSSSDDESSNSSITSSSGGMLASSYGPALLLTDIQGIEDHHGDMDFKIAGTANGITAVQLDTKLPGVDLALLEAALAPAAAARQKILAVMSAAAVDYDAALPAEQSPQYGNLELMKELVPRLIGPQGSTLLQIEESCSASLIVDDTGAVSIYAPTRLKYQHAVLAVQEVEGRGLKAGQIYRVKVLRVVDFGAYVSLPNGLPALLHVSELSHSKIREVRDVVTEGEELDVLCKGRDAKGLVRLSLKDLLPNPADGEAAASAAIAAAAGKGSVDVSTSGSTGSSSRESRGGRRPVSHGPRAMTWQPPKQQGSGNGQ